MKKNFSELVLKMRGLVIIINLYFFSRFILKYNLFSFIKYDIELLIAKFDILLA